MENRMLIYFAQRPKFKEEFMKTKKLFFSVFIFSLALVITGSALALPSIVNYQGRITDEEGVPIDSNLTMRFLLYASTTGGSAYWQEEQTVSVNDGVYNVRLGSVVPLVSDDFAGDLVYLEIAVYNTDTTNWETLSPRQQLTSTAYAFQAENAENLDGHPSSYFAPVGHEHGGDDITTPIAFSDSSSGALISAQNTIGDGVVGKTGASDKSGVYGWSDQDGTGVTGRAEGQNDGVAGITYSTDAGHAGVSGRNNGAGAGVYGENSAGPGVKGNGYYGVQAEGSQAGVHATSDLYGIWASTSAAPPAAAVYGYNNQVGGHAIHGEATGSHGVGVYSDGDLVVTGAYKGNIGGNQGAPFPRPAYNSGWVEVPSNDVGACHETTLQTGLAPAGYDNDNFFVDLQTKMTWSHLASNEGIGLLFNDDDSGYAAIHGAYYEINTDNSITVRYCGETESIRVRIWYYR